MALTMTPPPGAPVDRLTFHYDVIFHHLITHTAVVTLASDWRSGVLGRGAGAPGDDARHQRRARHRPLRGELVSGIRRHVPPRCAPHRRGDRPPPVPARPDPPRAAGRGGRALGRLCRVENGLPADRQGRDRVHPRPLDHARVRRAGMGAPARALVESAIALSILVSAVHALVPIFRGREVFIAGGFGLVHGLAFAATLTGFGFDPLTMVSSVLGFNLGIEAVQLLVILAAMPWLVLLARSRVYGPFRITGAALTGIAAAAWLAERAFGWANPIVPLRRKCRVSRPLAARRSGRPDLRSRSSRKTDLRYADNLLATVHEAEPANRVFLAAHFGEADRGGVSKDHSATNLCNSKSWTAVIPKDIFSEGGAPSPIRIGRSSGNDAPTVRGSLAPAVGSSGITSKSVRNPSFF